MPFRHDSIYNSPPRSRGLRVLIMRRWPRGVRKDRVDEWFPDAAPSLDLLETYKDGTLSFDAFAQRYEAEMRARPEALEHLRELERRHGTVVLLCWERPPQHCHREVLVRLLDTQGKARRQRR
jgi:uncharacterized protein YeaO (DUF488 family)